MPRLQMCYSKRQLLLRATRHAAGQAKELATRIQHGATEAATSEIQALIVALNAYADRVRHSKHTTEWLDCGQAIELADALEEFNEQHKQ